MATTRIFKSGNSQAVRIPAELAYPDTTQEVEISRMGDVITISPKRGSLRDLVERWRRLPKIPPMEPIERVEPRDTLWDEPR